VPVTVCERRSKSAWTPAPTRRPRLHDEGVPYVERTAAEAGGDDEASCAAAAELVGLHGDVDAGRATL
jgi:hypothetical protein